MSNLIQNRELISDVQQIYLGNLGTVDTDIKLPTTGQNGSQFQWHSDEHLFLSDDGQVTRPMAGVGNRLIHLKLTATLGRDVVHKQYDVTVLQDTRQVAIAFPIGVVMTVYRADYQLPQVVVVQLADGSYSTSEVVWEQQFDPKKSYQIISGKLKENKMPTQARLAIEIASDSKINNPFVDSPVQLLGHGSYTTGYQTMLAHLKMVNIDCLLYNFRTAAGLPADNQLKMTGWDAPDGNLRGHTTGHYMSALALAYFNTQQSVFKDKLTYLVAELVKCQQSLEKNGAHHGFLSAYDESQFDKLEQYETYPNIWAPYYTLDKILSGLLDIYHYTNNHQALFLAKGIGDWTANRLGRLSHKKLTKMWSIYIAGEFGGMISALVRLYRLTGEISYLETAKLFDNDKLYLPMLTNYDTLNTMHANQHIPQVIGAMDLYEETGNPNYLTLAKNFWRIVVNHHTFVNGGVGETEMFHEPDTVTKYLTDKPDETCASYNMFKLSRQLFDVTQDSQYMAYAENILVNHLLVANDHADDGGSTYFLPLRPGGVKHYDTDQDNTCCHGTGLENMVRFQKDIYAYDGHRLYINLFESSSMELPEGSGKVQLQMAPTGMTVKASFHHTIDVLIRIPKWANHLEVTVNDHSVKLQKLNGYLKLGGLVGGQTVKLTFSQKLAIVPAPDNPQIVSVFLGRNLLAEKANYQGFLSITQDQINNVTIAVDDEMVSIGKTELVPFNTIRNEPYHVYFELVND